MELIQPWLEQAAIAIVQLLLKLTPILVLNDSSVIFIPLLQIYVKHLARFPTEKCRLSFLKVHTNNLLNRPMQIFIINACCTFRLHKGAGWPNAGESKVYYLQPVLLFIVYC